MSLIICAPVHVGLYVFHASFIWDSIRLQYAWVGRGCRVFRWPVMPLATTVVAVMAIFLLGSDRPDKTTRLTIMFDGMNLSQFRFIVSPTVVDISVSTVLSTVFWHCWTTVPSTSPWTLSWRDPDGHGRPTSAVRCWFHGPPRHQRGQRDVVGGGWGDLDDRLSRLCPRIVRR